MSQVEDAATIATEYISTLDNVPSEIQYILAEIREREERIRELQDRNQGRTSTITRHASKSVMTEKDDASLAKIQADLVKIATAADEKVELAKRIHFILRKARGRLQYDLQRIQNPPEQKAEESILVYSGSSRTPLQPAIEALKSSVIASSPAPELPAVVVAAPSPSPAPQPREGRDTKRRRLNTGAAVAAVTPVQPVAPAVAPALPRTNRSAANATQTTTTVTAVSNAPTPVVPAPTLPSTRPRRAVTVPSKLETDPEPDDITQDGFDNDGDPDDGPYCICQQNSYGEMIGCDNGSDCPYQWFHLPCVNVAKPLPNTWYCDDCSKKLGLDNNGTSGNAVSGSERGRKRRTR